jgi:histidine triad (HIT) family protein
VSDACIFCKIVRGEIPAEFLANTDDAIAIRDINAMAPTHVLVIPKRHVTDLSDFAGSSGDHEIGSLFRLADAIGRDASASGYRLVSNKGADAGQTVFHLHLHVLAGRPMGWPPG